MDVRTQRIAELEWANYAATAKTSEVTPGLEVVLRDDIILTSSQAFPTPDTNHACLLRATEQTANDLISEVVDYFQSRELAPTVYVSPACAPDDLPARLTQQGFARQEEEEMWMVLDLEGFDIPAPKPEIAVRRIDEVGALPFAEVFMQAFGMPTDFAPQMVQLLEPSLGLPGVYHYLAFADGQPVGTCSLLCYESFGILGSAGVLPDRREQGVATDLAIEALTDAREQGVDTVMLQTTADTWLERFLRISGFQRAFTRTCFALTR